MIDNEKGKIRLISRGLPDDDEEEHQQVVISPPQVPIAPAKERRVLDLSASRKRKTIEPNTGEQTVLVLPSPTTQIARQIDSIRLAGTPVYGYTSRVPMLGSDVPPRDDLSSAGQSQRVGTDGSSPTSHRSLEDTAEKMVVEESAYDMRVKDKGMLLNPAQCPLYFDWS